jgi:tetratricopeptide (TPR) repeat protein
LKMREKYYPTIHVDIADSLNNIGVVYKNQRKPEVALYYYQRALTIYEKFLPIGHPNRDRIERNIRQMNGEK